MIGFSSLFRSTITSILVVFGVVFAPVAHAATYNYFGNPYTLTSSNIPGPASTRYTSTMSVLFSFSVSAPLLPSSTFDTTNIGLLSYFISDGLQTLTDVNSNIASLNISTDSSANISFWSVAMFQNFPTPTSVGDFSGRISTSGGTGFGGDEGNLLKCSQTDGSGNFIQLE